MDVFGGFSCEGASFQTFWSLPTRDFQSVSLDDGIGVVQACKAV